MLFSTTLFPTTLEEASIHNIKKGSHERAAISFSI